MSRMSNSYMNTYLKNKYYRMKKWAINILGGKCNKCGSRDNLEFDHMDENDKNFNISEFLRSYPVEKIEEELKKCQLLCEDCHKYKTAMNPGNIGEKNGSSKLKEEDVPDIINKIKNGMSLRKIGKIYGVSHVTILAIKKNKTWKDIGRVDREA